MELYYVNYYNQFHCIGAACEDTCCAVWGIEIDDKTYKKYKSCQGEWGERFRSSIDEEQCFHMKEDSRECVFLNDRHLCDIQSAFGEGMLCRTCRMFPRHMEDYGERREFMLSLACPEAARMILFKKEPAVFYKKVKERPVPKKDETDRELLTAILKLRDCALKILQIKESVFPVKASMILALGHDADSRIKRRDWDGLEKLLARYRKEGASERFVRVLAEKTGQNGKEQAQQEKVLAGVPIKHQMKQYLHMLEGLELLDEKWNVRLAETQKLLYEEETEESYGELLHGFLKAEKEQEYIYENILEYFICSYLAGAVFDSDEYTKVKFALYSMLVIRELYLARYKKNRAAGRMGLTHSDRVELAYWYSREVENSQNNLDALDIVLEAHPEFEFGKLLGCLQTEALTEEKINGTVKNEERMHGREQS